MSVRCLVGVWKVSGRCLEGGWKVCGRCVEGVWNVSGRCLEGVWKVSVSGLAESMAILNIGWLNKWLTESMVC